MFQVYAMARLVRTLNPHFMFDIIISIFSFVKFLPNYIMCAKSVQETYWTQSKPTDKIYVALKLTCFKHWAIFLMTN